MQVTHCTCYTVGYFFSLTNDNYKKICLHEKKNKKQAGRQAEACIETRVHE